VIVLVLGLAVALIVLIDLLVNRPEQQSPLLPIEPNKAYQHAFQRAIDPANIERHTVAFSTQPHIAGSAHDNDTASYVLTQWRAFGIEAHLEVLPVNLSYPLRRHVAVTFPPESAYTCQLREAVVNDGTSQNPDAVATFNGYGASGNVTAPLVYVNYGTADDYALLASKNVSLIGTVVIARYGRNYRGDKVAMAAARGALAVLIYNDPADVGPPPEQQSYPQGPWATNSTVQRGSVWNGNGDPGTPGWPSTADAPRVTLEQAQTPQWSMNQPLPTIPVQPLSWGDAQPMLLLLRGTPLPNASWAGGFNLQYVGPGPVQVNVDIGVNNTVVPITNVIGVIRGAQEPDRLVVLGCHRDAWTFGSSDPISGQSTLMEVSRALAYLYNNSGWRPRRTIMFASWDAEEYALVGSTEFVETHYRSLAQQAVVYLNLDVGVSGTDKFSALGSPMLHSVLSAVLTQVNLPAPKKGPVYNIWDMKLGLLDDGSDYGGETKRERL
jgi:N-acetylated-alpha-linked acidic dipeptidase